MDVHAKVAQIRRVVEDARSLPLSSSCAVNRSALLESLDELASMLRSAMYESNQLTADRDGVLSRAQADADRIVAQARAEQEQQVSDSEVYRNARRISDELVSVAREEAASLRREIDDYVDERFASLELSLQKTLDAVARGRRHLQGRSEFEELRPAPDRALRDPFVD